MKLEFHASFSRSNLGTAFIVEVGEHRLYVRNYRALFSERNGYRKVFRVLGWAVSLDRMAPPPWAKKGAPS